MSLKDYASMGPAVDPRRHPRGMCVVCWDQNEHRKSGVLLGERAPMICRMCKKRLRPFFRVIPSVKFFLKK